MSAVRRALDGGEVFFAATQAMIVLPQGYYHRTARLRGNVIAPSSIV
jgi:hypothetical protein